ncbi:hypothetical protein [Mesorhizobium sp. LjNodule214]|uniref:hypothetical protein n=1 Tax=Mesorhizobium sp. LjNodule214 TaxID=3342252 RepID=UPI003ECDD220
MAAIYDRLLHNRIVGRRYRLVAITTARSQDLHEALLKTAKDITGRDAAFIRWHGTGPVQQHLEQK